jgi:hypothetical protein
LEIRKQNLPGISAMRRCKSSQYHTGLLRFAPCLALISADFLFTNFQLRTPVNLSFYSALAVGPECHWIEIDFLDGRFS